MTVRVQGESFDGYTLISLLGEGGYGEVWAAERAGQRVAIKFLSLQTREAQSRFDAEAKALRDVDHANCVRLRGTGTLADSTRFIVMDYVEGPTLGSWSKQPHGTEELLDVARSIASALAAIHARGIVHRDLKPANIIVSQNEGRWHPVLLDFGISKLQGRTQQDITKTGIAIGTPGFMSPEQLRGQKNIGGATDMYAFGCLLYVLFDGAPAFNGDSAIAVSMAQLSGVHRPLQRAPTFVVDLAQALLLVEPTRRPTAAAALRALTPAATDAQSVRPTEPPSNRALTVTAIGLLAVVAVVGFVAANALREEPVPRPLVPNARNGAALTVEQPKQQQANEPTIVAYAGSTPDVDIPPLAQCENLSQYTPGYHRIDGTLVRLPANYDRTRQHPVIVLFHDAHATQATILESLDESAVETNESGYIFIAPQGDPPAKIDGHWTQRLLMARVSEDVDNTLSELCVDRARIFAFGHGLGGRGASKFACRGGVAGLAGLAQFAYRVADRRQVREMECAVTGTVPLMAIYPAEDPLAPRDGSSGCRMGERWSIDRHINELRKGRRTRGKADTRGLEGGSCATHSKDPFLVTCEIDGNSQWPYPEAPETDITRLRLSLRKCKPGPRPTFPITAEVLGFFDSLPSKANEEK